MSRLATLAALLAVLVAPAAASARQAKPDLTVMSRNLYLGADIIKLATVPDLAAEEQSVRTLYRTVRYTNFPRRATALAAEIQDHHPDVIGLQEVARYYRTAPDTAGSGKTARREIYDWLAILQRRLRADGLRYTVAARQDEIDVQVPSASGYDLRMKLGNAVLVRAGRHARVHVTKALSGEFDPANQLRVPLADGQTIVLERGYAGIDARVAGKAFRFLDPHAEAYSAANAKEQFEELLAGPAHTRAKPVIIAGDFNSDPADPEPNAYQAVIGAGYVDTAKRTPTCCQVETLDNAVSELETWIDHIVVRPRAKVLSTAVVGNRASERTGGLWPSDHAGVVARLRLR